METPKLTKRPLETLGYIKLGLRPYVICKLMHVTKGAINRHVKMLVAYYSVVKPFAKLKDAHDIFLFETQPEIFFKYKEMIARQKQTAKERFDKNPATFLPKGV